MKNGINKVTLMGHAGDDPKYRETKDKNHVTNLSVATNEFYRDKEGKEVKTTEWHRVIAWDKRAELIKNYIKKGDPVYIEGKLRTSSWEDNGMKKYSTEIICDNVLFLNNRNSE